MQSFLRICAFLLIPLTSAVACKKKESDPDPVPVDEQLCQGDTILQQLQVVFAAGQPMALNPPLVVHLNARIPNRSDGPDFTVVNQDVTLTELPSSLPWDPLPELAVGQVLNPQDWSVQVKSGGLAIQKQIVRSDCKQLTWSIDLVEAVR
jgi:hypothetical protein